MTWIKCMSLVFQLSLEGAIDLYFMYDIYLGKSPLHCFHSVVP